MQVWSKVDDYSDNDNMDDEEDDGGFGEENMEMGSPPKGLASKLSNFEFSPSLGNFDKLQSSNNRHSN